LNFLLSGFAKEANRNGQGCGFVCGKNLQIQKTVFLQKFGQGQALAFRDIFGFFWKQTDPIGLTAFQATQCLAIDVHTILLNPRFLIFIQKVGRIRSNRV